MTYVDYGNATRVTDRAWGEGHLVFKQDTSHPGFATLPLAQRQGFIAYEFIDSNGQRQVLTAITSRARLVREPWVAGTVRHTAGMSMTSSPWPATTACHVVGGSP